MGTARRVEELYTAHVRLVRSICRSLLRDRNEAEDAMQQTFLSAQRALANGSSPREPAAWLATIARNECLARVRERMREPLPVEAEPTEFGVDAHSAAVSRYEVATLREALADLPRAQREAILLRELRGFSYDEVARALSVTTAAVESLIFRARRTLQVRLSGALPALSPIAFLGRLLGTGGGDVATPVVKVAVVGVGAALLAGGAVLGPRALGGGHGVVKPSRHTASSTTAAPPVRSSSQLPIWAQRPASAEPDDIRRPEGEATGTEPDSSNAPESSSSDVSSSDTSTPDTSTPDTSATESSTTETETDAVTTVPTTSDVTPAGETTDSGDSGDTGS